MADMTLFFVDLCTERDTPALSYLLYFVVHCLICVHFHVCIRVYIFTLVSHHLYSPLKVVFIIVLCIVQSSQLGTRVMIKDLLT